MAATSSCWSVAAEHPSGSRIKPPVKIIEVDRPGVRGDRRFDELSSSPAREEQQISRALMVSLRKEVHDELIHCSKQRFAERMGLERHSCLTDRTQRSADALRFGLRRSRNEILG
jgi:hypothetical protein